MQCICTNLVSRVFEFITNSEHASASAARLLGTFEDEGMEGIGAGERERGTGGPAGRIGHACSGREGEEAGFPGPWGLRLLPAALPKTRRWLNFIVNFSGLMHTGRNFAVNMSGLVMRRGMR